MAGSGKDYACVVAIDFGTTFSGYAFSFKTTPDDVKTNRNWGTSLGTESFKTPTCILFNEGQKFKSFGFDAQKEFTELDDGADTKCYFFELFKMELHKERRLPKTLKDKTGKEMETVIVFAEALDYLKKHFFESLAQDPSEYSNMIRWVITVPAIWSFQARGFMRDAALQAGLIDNKESQNLVLALEPEAGSIYCRNLDIKQFADACQKEDMQLEPGTRYIVLDAGGGTLDVTVHEVLEQGDVKEIHFATGGAHGGANVNERFVELMEQVLGKDFIGNFKMEHPAIWLTFTMDFENKKKACGGSEISKVSISLPYQLGESYQTFTGDEIKKSFRKNTEVKLSNGMIKLKNTTLQSLFQDLLDDIRTHIRDLVNLIPDITYIFMVGGFSDSKLLQTTIINAFGLPNAGQESSSQSNPRHAKHIRVMIPQEAAVAVVKGAVMFGHNPLLIKERKARHYYGIEVHPKYSPRGKYNIKFKNKFGDVPIFDKKINKGALLGTFDAGSYRPKYENQTRVSINVYYLHEMPSSPERIIYIEDDEEDKDGKKYRPMYLGTVQAPLPGYGKERKIKVTLEFGGTEIDVKSDCNGEIIKGSIDCILEYEK